MPLIRNIAMLVAFATSLAGCGDSPTSSTNAFTFEENFEFEEPGNIGPNVTPDNVTTNNSTTNNQTTNNSTNNTTPIEPACPTETIGESPEGVAAIDRGGAGPIVAFRSGSRIETYRRTDTGWEFVTDAPARGAREVEVAGFIEGRTSTFYMATAADNTRLYLCSSDGCGERTDLPFADAVELHATSDTVVYVAGITLEEPLPTLMINFVAGDRAGRHAFAEAPSIPSQFGLTPISLPPDPGLRTEFRAAWDTGDTLLSFISVNTSLLMELEPECNRLDVLGGRVVPLQSDRGILVSASGDRGPALTFDACDGVSAPVVLEESRGVLDFDVAQNLEPSSSEVYVYWILGGSLYGTAIDPFSGDQIQPTRRIAAVPGAQGVRATILDGVRTIVVTLEDQVVGIVDEPDCSEFVEF